MDTALNDLIAARVDALEPELIALRRDLHAHPEIGYQEHRTTEVVRERLEASDIRTRRLDGTGLVAELGAEQPTIRIGLRADLDALPVQEQTGLPFASLEPGMCHACGHDVHTAGVLGATLALAAVEQQLLEAGIAVRAIFQPAEEVLPGGAESIVAQGELVDVDRIFAVHCDPSIDVGTVGLAAGPITAACDDVTVTVTGRGGHTSRPHLTGDLTYALAKVITDVPAVLSRRLDPRAGAALVWGAVHAGSAPNVIPSSGTARGTLRMLDAQTWLRAEGLVEQIVHEVVAPYRVHAEVHHERGVPPVVNDDACIDALRRSAATLIGTDAPVGTPQSLGGEDFSWMLQRTPGALARLGTRTPGGATYELHQGNLVVDERAVAIAAKVLAGAVLCSGGIGFGRV